MDASGWVVLGLMYVVFSALRKAGSRPSGGRSPTTRKPEKQTPAASTAPRVPGAPDPTQREGARLQDLLRDLGRTLDQAAGPIGRAPDRPLPTAAESGLEAAPTRGERTLVDQDDEAEAVIARRLRQAADHGQPLTAADHSAFDERIRQEPADKTATRAYTAAQLRNAVVWREILGPPVSLREPPA